MLDAVIWWLLTPLTVVLSFLLDILRSQTPHFAIAMMLLGVAMSILQQPFQAYARRLTQKEKKRQEQLQPLLSKIRRSYRAGERFAMIRTLYRQNHYHPAYAFGSAATLLLQLPFFFVAYLFLQQEGVVPSVAWGAIADLSLADGLLAGGRLNLLPFFMFALNLMACFYETRGQKLKDSWQLYLLALLFFVLLYQRSAAMLLYWSSSSATTLLFSVLRNKGSKLPLNLWTSADQPTKLFLRLRLSSVWQLVIFVLFIHQILIYLGFFRQSLKMEFLLILPVLPFAFYYAILGWSAFYRSKKNTLFLVQTAFLMIILMLLVTTLLFDHLSFIARNLRRLALLFSLGMSSMALPFFLSPFRSFYKSLVNTTIHQSFLLYSFSSAVSCFLVFVIAPLQLLTSLPSEGKQQSWIIYQIQLPRAVVLLILLLLFYTLFKKKKLLAYLSCFFAIIALINMARPFNLSEGMLGFFLAERAIGVSYKDIIFDLFSLFFALALLFFFAWRHWQAQLVKMSAIIFLTLIGLFFYYKNQLAGENHSTNYEAQPFVFNQNKANVLVVFLDRFSSIIAKEIFTREKDIRAGFDGFTWYDNSFSQGRGTLSGFMPIYGGYDYNYTNVDKDLSIHEVILEAYEVTTESFADAGFKVDLFDPAQLEGNMVMSCQPWSGSNCHQLAPPNFSAEADTSENKNSNVSALYYGSLRTALPSLRKLQAKLWFLFNVFPKELTASFTRLWEVMLHLPQMSRTEENNQGQGNLLLFYNPAPHYPGYLDAKGDYGSGAEEKDIPNELRDKFSDPDQAGHYYVAKASLEQLSSWWTWMKQNQVYDNTRIIVVADHGYYFDPDEKYKNFNTVIENSPYNLSEFSILFMMKDFNTRGELRIDNTFMSNGDTPHLASENLGIKLRTPHGEPLISPLEAKKSLSLYSVDWRTNYKTKIKDVSLDLAYRLKGGSQPENIEIITEK